MCLRRRVGRLGRTRLGVQARLVDRTGIGCGAWLLNGMRRLNGAGRLDRIGLWDWTRLRHGMRFWSRPYFLRLAPTRVVILHAIHIVLARLVLRRSIVAQGILRSRTWRYGRRMKRALTLLDGLLIAPLHGPIRSESVGTVLQRSKWARGNHPHL
jgi:hypothetical protein